MNTALRILCFVSWTVLFLAPQSWSAENYAEQIRLQITEIQKDYPQKNRDYFRDMGIAARKADDAGFTELTAEMVRSLMSDIELYVKKEIEEINKLYERDAFQAARRMSEVNQYQRYFQPSEDFLKTALGKSINMELIQFRTNVLEDFSKGCSLETLSKGVQAIQKSGLFITRSAAEIENLQKIVNAMTCCLAWKPEIILRHTQDFESPYDKGTVTEDAQLRLESSRADLSQARWVGEWAYRYTGREGKGEGVSQGILTYHKGAEFAELKISTPRVSSTGRMNFPNVFSGERRSLQIGGKPLAPHFMFHGQEVEAIGCQLGTPKSEVKTKTPL